MPTDLATLFTAIGDLVTAQPVLGVVIGAPIVFGAFRWLAGAAAARAHG